MHSTKQIVFVKDGYDSFIDFIKAYAIICVLIGHTIPNADAWGYFLWAGMQVPLFILIQTFHFYKKETTLNVKRIIQRVIVPFVLIGIVTFVIKYYTSDMSAKSLIINGIANGGGYGPGSYYPLIYIQIALLLTLFRPLFNKFRKCTLLLLFLILSELCEIASSFLDISDVFYRILACRYIFLLYLGWLWVKDGIKINIVTIVLSIISFLIIIYFEYISNGVNSEPWFFNTEWKCHRWPCFYYVSNGLVVILYYLWQCLKRNERICALIKTVASASYEIFLVQMCLIFLLKQNAINVFDSETLNYALWLITIWCISFLGGICFCKVYNKFLENICTRKLLRS